ncbi:MAG: sulfatase-like hydrolase/transferase, partial [Opitutales bacterium]
MKSSTITPSPIIIVIAFALLIGVPFAGGADTDKRPNVVLILSDDQSWWHYGFMEHEDINTPRLDRLADESLLMTRGYVPSSLCR